MAWIGIISWDGYTYDDGEQPKDRERERETARSKLKKPFWFFGIVAIFFVAICYVMINVFNREKSETEAIAHTHTHKYYGMNRTHDFVIQFTRSIQWPFLFLLLATIDIYCIQVVPNIFFSGEPGDERIQSNLIKKFL